MSKNILFVLIIFLANAIQAITGFAGTVLAMPASIFLIGIESSKVVLNAMGIFASLWILLIAYKFINWKELLKVVVLMLIGMVAGMYLYSILPIFFLLKIYAVFIILIAIKGIVVKEEKDLNEWILILIVLVAGMIHGMFVSGGPLLMIYILKKSKNKSVFRANISTVWIILNSYLAFTHYKQDLYTPFNLQILGLGIIPLGIGTIIGNRLHQKISQKNFLYLSYVLLFISGMALLFK